MDRVDFGLLDDSRNSKTKKRPPGLAESRYVGVSQQPVQQQGVQQQAVLRDFRNSMPPTPTEDDSFQTEFKLLLKALPPAVVHALSEKVREEGKRINDLVELYIQLGRFPEAIFADEAGVKERVRLCDACVQQGDIGMFYELFNGEVPTHKRIGIPGTLHRISVITHPGRKMGTVAPVIGVTARIGRVVSGALERLAPFLLEEENRHKSLVLVGRPGVGKTTVLRELARLLSARNELNVVVVDKTCEIAGDGEIPHAAIGSARWMPVGMPELQPQILREAVENQSPDVVIVDEISTQAEVDVARTISQRGVRLIATVHGESIAELMNCKERGPLTGGHVSVTLADTAAAKRQDQRKTVSKRRQEPVFHAALELHERERWVYHPHVKDSVDSFFNGEPVDCEELTPGMSHRLVGIPTDTTFDYCRACSWNVQGQLCPKHRPKAKSGDSAFRGSSNMQCSGNCYRCGEPGHFARNCPNM